LQYYASTANPHHLTIPANSSGQDTPAGLREIGRDTQSFDHGVPQFNTPNHNYDMSDFDQLVSAINHHELPGSALPAVSFLKAPGFQDGHAANSDPADEQQFVTHVINSLERSPDWSSTAVLVSYDDSDGWDDHAYSGVMNPSPSPSRQRRSQPERSVLDHQPGRVQLGSAGNPFICALAIGAAGRSAM
jgi:phospholipase C